MASTSQQYYELRDPFDEWTVEDMRKATKEFANQPDLHDYVSYFERGGMLNLDPAAYQRSEEGGIEVSRNEREALETEYNPQGRFDRFRQTRGLYVLVGLCSAAAAGTPPPKPLYWLVFA